MSFQTLSELQVSAGAKGKHVNIRSGLSISQPVASPSNTRPLDFSFSYINLSHHFHHCSLCLNSETRTTSDMLSSNFISASVYNELPGINDNQAIPHATLRALGQLFAAFKVEQRVGVGLLHKHFKLAPDTIMVHDGHVCKPESIHSPVSVLAHRSSGTVQTFKPSNTHKENP